MCIVAVAPASAHSRCGETQHNPNASKKGNGMCHTHIAQSLHTVNHLPSLDPLPRRSKITRKQRVETLENTVQQNEVKRHERVAMDTDHIMFYWRDSDFVQPLQLATNNRDCKDRNTKPPNGTANHCGTKVHLRRLSTCLTESKCSLEGFWK